MILTIITSTYENDGITYVCTSSSNKDINFIMNITKRSPQLEEALATIVDNNKYLEAIDKNNPTYKELEMGIMQLRKMYNITDEMIADYKKELNGK